MISKQEEIIKIARAGAQFSRQMRNVWTGVKESNTVLEDEFYGIINDLMIITVIAPKLVSYCRLNKIFYAGTDDMFSWNEQRWEAEIKSRIG